MEAVFVLFANIGLCVAAFAVVDQLFQQHKAWRR